MSFNPTSITGCFLWFESTSIVGVTNGGSISSPWTDLSGSGNTVYPTGTPLPTFQTNVINGYPTVSFNGTGGYFDTQTHNQSLELSASGLSLYTVYRSLDTSDQQIVCCIDRHGGPFAEISNFMIGNCYNGQPSGWFYANGYPQTIHWDFIQANSPTTGQEITGSGFVLRSDRFTPSGFYFSLMNNAAFAASGSCDTHNDTSTTFKIGTSAVFSNILNGDIAEIIGYNTQLSIDNHQSVINYLYQKYFPNTGNSGPFPGIPGCFLWFQSTSITGVLNGGSITNIWPDLSGSGNDLTPSNIISPIYNTNVVNGYPAISLSGGSFFDSITHNQSLEVSSSGLTLYGVYSTNDPYSQQYLYGATSFIANVDYGRSFLAGLNLNGRPSGWFYSCGLGPGPFNIGGNFTTCEAYTPGRGYGFQPPKGFVVRTDRFATVASGDFEQIITSDGFAFARNAVDAPASSILFTYPDINTTFKVGADYSLGSNFLNGSIVEILGYSSQLTETNHDIVSQYFINKYGLGTYNNFPLYVGSTTQTQSGIPLYLATNSIATGVCSLFTRALLKSSGEFPLWVGSTTAVSSGFPLYAHGKLSSSSGLSLWMSGTPFLSHGITLFTEGNSQQSQIPLFVWGKSQTSTNISLYVESSQAVSSGLSLFMVAPVDKASGTPPWFMPLYMNTIANPSTTGNLTLFMQAPSTTGINIKTYYKPMPLYIFNQGPEGSLPLFIGNTDTASIPYGYLPLFISGPTTTGIIRGSIDLFVENIYQYATQHTKLFTKGLGGLNGGYLLAGSIPLYIDRLPAAAFRLFIDGKSTDSNSFSMVVSGVSNNSNNMSLFISGYPPDTSSISLYTHGIGIINQGINLWTSGNPYTSQGFSMFERGF